ncbi:hypothetical protein FY145_10525 [Agrobacterium tumefaciens]|uniref:Apea-like HEPN domain-containing protein n=1 Tax=Agrobacterium tumefaciens TaxID=358 RepID=A0AAP9E4E8_AGRTU|nr:hypothetical protein [Agrobacterium tumefaciens]NSZ58456.1 hypothetical protein [Agrobacterium tumefaciens]QDY94531.1 hypothetical protein CG010_010640 [Agrobacterium tumefaciens]UXS49658.1 hypothetical protein FY149_20970 [Agrobacterium tumefaciens]UXS70909.1 hypothetical protein FY146_10525 [Agrobacterium tumefaciens]UXS78572.1 hypothetical protein FY145_10525 [Agrobacterium tumefaciens]
MLDQNQFETIERARAGFITVSTEGHTPFDDRTYVAFLQQHDLTHVTNFPYKQELSGFTTAARAEVSALAKSVRAASSARARSVSHAFLTKALDAILIGAFRDRSDAPLDAAEQQALDEKLTAWFDSHAVVRTHYIPCILSPYADERFSIGPVRFHHLSDFPAADFGMTIDEVDALDESNDFHGLTDLKRFIAERHADWVAVIGIADHEPNRALTKADLSVDVALAIVQLATSFDHYRGIARATARMAPAWRPNILRTSDGGGSGGIINLQPGRSVAPEGLGIILKANSAFVTSMGTRLTGYVEGMSALPVLDETWCNAAYWYHEAIAEPLETIAIAKLETAIEVLFRSESSSRSTSRLVNALEIFFGLAKDDMLPNGTMTAGEFAATIVTARSRVLHGTWQTLTSDLPEGKGGNPVSLAATEQFARSLLVKTSVAIDSYTASGNPADSVEGLLAWVRAMTAGKTSV